MNGTEDEVAGYENDLATRLGVRHVVATSSGTAAIHTALHAAGVRLGDEVLVPALSVVMTAAPVLHLGARPVAVDCTSDGTALDPDDLAAKTGSRTRAVVPVLLWGRADPHAELTLDHARRHRLAVVVDACQALGTTPPRRRGAARGPAGPADCARRAGAGADCPVPTAAAARPRRDRGSVAATAGWSATGERAGWSAWQLLRMPR